MLRSRFDQSRWRDLFEAGLRSGLDIDAALTAALESALAERERQRAAGAASPVCRHDKEKRREAERRRRARKKAGEGPRLFDFSRPWRWEWVDGGVGRIPVYVGGEP